MRRFYVFAVCLTVLLGIAGRGDAAESLWTIDPAHSSAAFAVKHFALASVKGVIPLTAGTIAVADGSNVPSHVEATLDVRRLDTRDDDRNADLRSAHWFDVEKYPTATFASTRIDGKDATHFTLTGELTMHGVTKPVTLEGTFEGRGAGGHGEKRVAFNATGAIDRRDWALTDARTNAFGALVVGNTADLTLEVEAVGK